MVGKTLSHYVIEAELGRGGMGIVYKARDTKLDRTVALKLLPAAALASDDDRTRFYREAKAAAQLHHPNIASIFEIDEAVAVGSAEDDVRPFIAMEFIDGEPLENRIKKGPIPIDEAVRIASEIAEGLKEAHEKSIVHRDIKSANVMLDKNSRAKILDFGLAKTTQSTMLTRMGSTIGTISYMSPEQARGQEVDHRTDLWALGTVLYEMVAGRLPFGGDYEQAIVYSIMNEDPEPLTSLRTGVPMDLEWITGELLGKDAANRYNSADDVLIDLKNIKARPSSLSHSSVIAGPAQPRPGTKEPKGAFSWQLAVAAFAILAVGLLGGRMLGGGAPKANTLPMHFSLLFEDLREIAHPEFSPDGRSLLFSASDSGSGLPSLYVYDLVSKEKVRLPDTESYGFGSFSPDGSMIGFARDDDRIEVMRNDGQSKSEVASASNSAISWSSTSSLLLDPQDGIIREVFLDGKPEIIVAAPDTTLGERFFWWPQMLPGGDHIMYTALYTDEDETARELRVLDRKTGSVSPILSGGGSARYIPSGHIIYSTEDQNQYIAQSFDLASLSVTGPPVRFAYADFYSVAYSPEDVLVYKPIKEYVTYSFFRLGSQTAQPFQLVIGPEDGIRISEGGAVALIKRTSGKQLELILHDPESSYEQVLVQRDWIATPRFSPDEQSIAFITGAGDAEHIEMIDVASGNMIAEFPFSEREAWAIEDWHPSRNALLLSSSSRENIQRKLTLLDLDTDA